MGLPPMSTPYRITPLLLAQFPGKSGASGWVRSIEMASGPLLPAGQGPPAALAVSTSPPAESSSCNTSPSSFRPPL